MTCAHAYLTSAENADEEIDRVLLAMLKTARPGYITIPTDLVYAKVDASRLHTPLLPLADPLDERMPNGKMLKEETQDRLDFVVSEIERLWETAKDPIVLVDACAIRFGVGHLVEELVRATGVRWYTSASTSSAPLSLTASRIDVRPPRTQVRWVARSWTRTRRTGSAASTSPSSRTTTCATQSRRPTLPSWSAPFAATLIPAFGRLGSRPRTSSSCASLVPLLPLLPLACARL